MKIPMFVHAAAEREKLLMGPAVMLVAAAGGFALGYTRLPAALTIGGLFLALYYRNSFIRELSGLIKTIEEVLAGQSAAAAPRLETEGGQVLQGAIYALSDAFRLKVDKLQHQAHCDPLTGLPNRNQFKRLVELKLVDMVSYDGVGAMFFLDIDGFKQINDTLGHANGDEVLMMVSSRISLVIQSTSNETSPKDDFIFARLGGDEFTIFAPGIHTEANAVTFADRLRRVLSEPFALDTMAVTAGCSIGIAFSKPCGSRYENLLRSADLAMYHAKKLGRNRCEVYSKSLDDEMARMSEMEADLIGALAHDEFYLEFQPQIDCRSLRVVSAEALIRWRHPKRGVVGPTEFISVAERLDLISAIGDWVLIEAIKTAADFAANGLPIRIAINVSPLQLKRPDFITMVTASLEKWGTPPGMIELEITESVAMHEDATASDRLARLRVLGVTIAIDDFGTGYSNLARLTHLPIDRLKIDRSLITDVMEKSEFQILIQAIISMANGLGLETIAEGIETQDQMDLLTAIGCDIIQGFLISRPVSAAELVSLRQQVNNPRTIGLQLARSA